MFVNKLNLPRFILIGRLLCFTFDLHNTVCSRVIMGGASSSCNSCSSNQIKSESNKPNTTSSMLRLWAEVFHVSAASGVVKWTQVSHQFN